MGNCGCNNSCGSWWGNAQCILQDIRGAISRLATYFYNYFYRGNVSYRNIDLGILGVSVTQQSTRLQGYYIFNASVTPLYVKIYDKNSAPTAADSPLRTLGIPPVSAANLAGLNLLLLNGFGLRASRLIADNDNTALTANDCSVNFEYQVNVS